MIAYFIQPKLIGMGLFQFLKDDVSAFVKISIFLISVPLTAWMIFKEDLVREVNLNGLIEKSYEEFKNKIAHLANNTIKEQVPAKDSVSEVQKELKIEHLIDEQLVEEKKIVEDSKNIFRSIVMNSDVVESLNLIEGGQSISNADDVQMELDKIEKPKVNDEKYYGLVKSASTKKGEQKFVNPDDKYFSDIISKIHNKLAEFKIEGRIINVLKGPVVDTFEWELGVGEKISKLTGASEDLSLALLGAPIRMVYPMKGRGTVGIEVPRNPREIIFLDDIVSAREFQNNSHQLPLAMGKDAFGEAVVVDLASMPHMLVAGATGAGKSVFINSILVSLLIKRSPNQMKLILIDPKQLELALYAKLPHLIMPVITDAKTASTALLWAVQEMERRYSIMTEFGVRNIEGFNHKLKRAPKELVANIRKFYEYETEDTYELPYIVIIVDEFADLILTQSGKDIEKNICRLAAKARAAGVHLVIATQRPSVDVITGLIKSNFPTRVSFRVTSSIDSRTILNAMGAEKLLGKGDMLYKYGVDTTRIHSSFVEEDEIELLTEKLAEIGPSFNSHVMEFVENGGEDPEAEIAAIARDSDVNGKDEKYDEAVRVVIEHRSASASLLQRRLGVGYNRAANLIEDMEANGVVGPAQGSKPRKVLMGSESIV
jgi:S-DNA-T family DNA segregation ATPase FtsK/SpoIIIE